MSAHDTPLEAPSRDARTFNRRGFLKTAFAGAAAVALQPALLERAWADDDSAIAAPIAAGDTPIQLSIVRRTIEVNGRAAGVYGIQQPDGTPGMRLRAGGNFNVMLHNRTAETTSVHWHGLTPPWRDDGVSYAPLPPIAAGGQRHFVFPLHEVGTYWMHAHTLQEQQLLAAPLIVADPDQDQNKRDEQEVVILLHDFSFTPPQELLARLKHGADTQAMGGMQMGGKPMKMDLNDIDYDAYLANDRTLDDPDVVPVERGGRVRVRVINGAAATAFTIDFGELAGTLIAVDGQPVQPLTGRRFALTLAQRIDVLLQLPQAARAFPILALREGGVERTGIVLQPRGAHIARQARQGSAQGPVVDLALETRVRAVTPLAPRKVDKTFAMTLAGDMARYHWSLDTQPALLVDRGDRVEVTMHNTSMMAHPMHLHGHHFQVVAIDGQRFAGAMRDTVLVPPMRSVTFAVDANNPGQWMFHCHNLYHMMSGMMTTFAYRT